MNVKNFIIKRRDMGRYKFTARIGSEEFHPKGFYYQGKKFIVLVGDEDKGHTIRRKELVEDVDIVADNETVKEFRLHLIDEMCAESDHVKRKLIERIIVKLNNLFGREGFNLG
jgi:hypothetical protein